MESSLVEAMALVPVFVRRPGGEIVHWTPGCAELFGYSQAEALGARSSDLLRTAFPLPLAQLEAILASEGEWSGRLRHRTAGGAELWTESVWRLRESRQPGGTIVVELNTDITARVKLEEKSALLARELEHRVKNILGVVQGLARMTFPDAPEEQRRALDRRINALSEANKVLHDAAWKQADLRTIVAEVAGGLDLARLLTCEGPDVAVSSADAMGLALVVHELCTNALKYGALSRDGGRVQFTWSVNADDDQPRTIHARWHERGGPPVKAPNETGFGMRLIRRALGRSGGTPVQVHFAEDGLVVEMAFLEADGPA